MSDRAIVCHYCFLATGYYAREENKWHCRKCDRVLYEVGDKVRVHYLTQPPRIATVVETPGWSGWIKVSEPVEGYDKSLEYEAAIEYVEVIERG